MLAELEKRLQDFELALTVTPAAREFLAEKGFDPTYGARPLRRAIQQLIEDQISEEILKGTFSAGDRIQVDLGEGKLKFSKAQGQEA
jgi:ATP-dependent Clp protease ATP-binding subunit ClpC